MEQTLAIIKPDAVKRGLMGDIIHRIEKSPNMEIVDIFMVHFTKEEAGGFYDVHEGKYFFDRLINFMSSGPSVVLLLEGENVIRHWREMMGPTNCGTARSGTLRGDYGVPGAPMHENIVHGSDSPESAKFEIDYFFKE